MVDTHVKVTRSRRIVPRVRFYEEGMLDVDVENKMAFLTCEPHRSVVGRPDQRTLEKPTYL